ncbi:MAG: DUF2461 domain-containing protein [Faecalibacterium sp.]|nr:DUF2461 domain-containing protein [Ruminococcus sp.]MCM1392246.1 DUF2461 domain-containing protein [Ruminococcus sp.]MCM1484949.1 DUF2461 domain-containing protein [Faecalibacterium sp.]
MDSFNGFDSDTLLLLAENKFNDSKLHYESVKESIKQKAIVPMRQICSDLCDQLFEIDEHMNLIPTKMVSRIRRDTRFSKNKDLYRENVWCMFMRHKHEWKYQPCMWFEFMPGGYSIGVGMFSPEPRYLDVYRKVMLENQKEFRTALKACIESGAIADMDCYKKAKEGDIAADLKPYYNAKYLYFIKYSSDLTPLFDGSVLQEIRETIRAYAPMYKFLIKVTEKMITEKGQSYD